MTNAELIQKIRAEIERLKGYYRITNPYDKRAIRVCENLLSFLSTLESEKPMNQAFDNNSQINILKDVIKVLTGKDTFNEAVMVSINAIQKAKKEVYQEQIAYDAYELLETSIRKLME